MLTTRRSNKRDQRALMVGAALIFLVGVFFIGKIFFGNRADLTPPLSGKSAMESKPGAVPLMAPDVLLQKIQNGDKITVVDIRTEGIFQNEHIAQALSLPIGLLQNFSPGPDEAVVIVFSAADLQTFETAKNILVQKSFPYFFLKGGFEGWKGINAPTLSRGDPNSFIDQSKITYIGTEDLKKMLSEQKASLLILDVQTEEHYRQKHIVGAVNIPSDQLEKRRNEIPAGRQIIVYGENDLVSFQGGVHLSDLGIFTARTLNGNNALTALSDLPLQP
ncbi:MAG: rhodanese-like domain-containing protein [Candidatus Moraniibacteriota bacterium]